MYNLLSASEINQINHKYKTRQEDEIVKLRNLNLQKIQPWIKVLHNTKKKHKNKIKEVLYKEDIYKFKKIDDTIRLEIKKIMKKNEIGLTTLCYKCNIQVHIVDKFLNYREPIDNSDLKKILDYLNYDVNNNKNILDLENISLSNSKLENIDLDNINIDKIY